MSKEGDGEKFIVYTEIVELPAVKVGGLIKFMNAELKKLSPNELQVFAKGVGGVVCYVKRRAEYKVIDDARLCESKDCYRPAKNDPVEDVAQCESCMKKSRGFKSPFSR